MNTMKQQQPVLSPTPSERQALLAVHQALVQVVQQLDSHSSLRRSKIRNLVNGALKLLEGEVKRNNG